jgi:hypothetical protein
MNNRRLPGWQLPCSAPSLCHRHPNFNRYEFSATYKLIPWLGAAAEFSDHYGTVTGFGSGHVETYSFGPELAFPAKALRLLRHWLAWPTRQSAQVPQQRSKRGLNRQQCCCHGQRRRHWPQRDTLSVFCAIQLDYLMTRFNSSSQNGPRFLQVSSSVFD